MASCRDCIHHEICQELAEGPFNIIDADTSCTDFKSRSRFVELPIKPGESFFMPAHNQISEYSVDRVVFSRRAVHIRHTLVSGLHYANTFIHPQEIGKDVFLTREEAERALKERESNG